MSTVFGGEHHRPDFAIASPPVVLTAIAQATERIRLTSTVTVLSTADPVKVFEDFTAVDLISAGRAEITAGRGAYTESFRLFGHELADYDALFVGSSAPGRHSTRVGDGRSPCPGRLTVVLAPARRQRSLGRGRK
jgi:hypothetical protein